MSLIIGVRCKNGCLVIADRRTHIKSNGTQTYQDDFHKVLLHNDYLVYNHGYNRIGDNDWKLRVRDLTPDVTNPVYAEILKEMESKPDKRAAYVFMNMTTLLEITICVGIGITPTDHMPNDRIVSGSGDKYVDLQLLTNLHKVNCDMVRPKLIRTFKRAHRKMTLLSGSEFSKEYDILRI
jgi:hypothetical protein